MKTDTKKDVKKVKRAMRVLAVNDPCGPLKNYHNSYFADLSGISSLQLVPRARRRIFQREPSLQTKPKQFNDPNQTID